MQSTPQRVSLILQTEKVLLDGIKLRRWQHELPGERRLSRELRISRWTLRMALARLAKRNILKIVHGVPCKISLQTLRVLKHESKSKNVALVSPMPLLHLHLFSLLWLDELRVRFNEQGILLNIFDSAKAYGRNPQHALGSLVAKNPHTDWILFNSTHLMQQWFQSRGETAVIAGSRFADIHLPAVDIDSHATGIHAGHTVLGLGHRRIFFLRPVAATAGDLAVEAGLKEIFGKASHTLVDFSVVTCKEETAEICRTIIRAIGESRRDTVVICARSTFVATVFSHLLRLGWRIPHDISLLSVEWEPFLDLVVPHISHYKVSPVEFAKQIAQCISRNPAKQKHAVFLTQQFIKGGSLVSVAPSAR